MNCNAQFEHRAYGTTDDRCDAIREAFEAPAFQRSCNIGTTLSTIKAELRSLIGKPNFGKFDNTFAFEEYDIPVAIREIRQTAPTWYFFMFDILRNVRNDQDHHPVSLKQENEAIPKKTLHVYSDGMSFAVSQAIKCFHMSLVLGGRSAVGMR